MKTFHWLLFLIFITISADPQANALEKVTLQLRWDHQFQFAGYYAAKWQGFYDAAGFDVDIRSAITETGKILSATKEVAEGRAQFGVGSADILLAKDQGSPLVVLATIFQQSAAEFYIKKSTLYHSLADLTRLRIARNPNDLIDVEFQALLSSEGIDINLLDVHPHVPSIDNFVYDKIDVLPGYKITVPYELKNLGMEYTTIRPQSFGIDFYGDSLFGHADLLKKDVNALQKFVQATQKGWKYALKNPDEIVRKIVKELPRQLPVENGLRFNQFQVQEVTRLTLFPIVDVGHINPHRWGEMHENLQRLGIVRNNLDIKNLIFDPLGYAQEARLKKQTLISSGLFAVSGLALLIFFWVFSLKRTVARRTSQLKGEIEERKKTQDALKQSEKKYRDLVELAQEGIWLIDKENKTVFVNSSMAKILGYTPQEMQTRNLFDFMDQEGIKVAEEKLQQRKNGIAEQHDFEFIHKKGHRVYATMETAPIFDENGNYDGAVAGVLDVTKSKLAQKEIQKNHDMLSMAETLADFGAWEWDVHTDTWTMSDNWLRLHGCTKKCLTTAELISVAHPDDLARIQKAFDRAVSEGLNYEIEHRIIKQDTGEERHVRAFGAPVFNEEGRTVKLCGSAQDITAQILAQKALQQEKALFKTIVDQLPVMITRYGPDAKMLFLNKDFEKKVGWTTTEAQDIDLMEKVYPDPEYRELAYQYMQRATQEWREFAISARSGNVIDSEWSNIRLEDGTQIGIGIDVTERKKVQKALIKNESLFRGLYDNMTSGSAIYEVLNDGSKGSDYIVRNFNKRSLEIEGKTLDQVVGRSLSGLRPNIDDYGLINAMKQVWETGEPAYFPIKLYEDETFSNYYENHIFKIPTGEVVTIYNDVTDQKNAEMALKASEERFKLAMESANDGLFDWNLKTNDIYYSPAWKRMLGYEDSELPNDFSVWETLTAPEDVQRSWEMQNQLIKKQRDRFEIEFKMKHRDGHWVDILSRANAIFDERGEAVRIVGTHVDLSERKKLEKQLRQAQRLEAIGNLAGGIAHDFNNILYPIIGFTQLSMEALPKNHPVQSDLTDILHGAKRARDLVKRILLFSRQQDQIIKPTSLKPVIHETVNLLRSSIPASIDIQTRLYDGDACVMCDETQIHEIVMNLCTNAYHALENDSGEIRISLARSRPDKNSNLPSGDYLCLSVADNGSGIPESDIDKIFDPYFTTKEVGKGSGLGLSVVHGIVKGYNGEITVESESGKGTTVNVYLPVSDRQLDNQDELTGTQGELSGKERILFVDDEQPIVKFGVRSLERLDYKLTGKNDSTQAWELIAADPYAFDLVITDMAMPGLDGLQLAKKIYEINSDLPVLICSGYSEKLDNATIDISNIQAKLDKPILVEDLVRKVREILDRRKTNDKNTGN